MKLAFFLFLFPLLTSVSAQSGKRPNSKKNSSVVNAAASNDPQKSLCLDSKVISKGFEQDGVAGGEPGQTPSLTSTNNFINFCLTVPGTPLTNGKQISDGSCNTAPMGFIPSAKKMPAAKFVSPPNGATIKANQDFQVQMAVTNLATGNFVNAQKNYYAAPQQLNKQGVIIGHSHLVIQTLQSLDQTTPLDPGTFAFFKGLNEAAKNGLLTADVKGGLPAGQYRICSINTSSNHVPTLGPVAQHGSFDDCSYFSAGDNGKAANKNSNNNKSTTGDGSTKTTGDDSTKTAGDDSTKTTGDDSTKTTGDNPTKKKAATDGGSTKSKTTSGKKKGTTNNAVNKTIEDCGDGKTRKNGKRRLTWE